MIEPTARRCLLKLANASPLRVNAAEAAVVDEPPRALPAAQPAEDYTWMVPDAPAGDDLGVADTELVDDPTLEVWGSVASVADFGSLQLDVKRGATAQLYLTSVGFPDEEPIIAAAPIEAAAPPVLASLDDVDEFARAKAAPSLSKSRSIVRIPFYPGLPLTRAKHVNGATGTVYEGRLTEAQFIAKEKKCLAEAIYHEARGEPILGQFAVAQTVLNRVRTDFYPNTVCAVVYQGVRRHSRACQFSFACDGIRDRTSEKKHWDIAKEIAERVADGKVWLPEVGHATHYHANYVRPSWRRAMDITSRVGRHIFYRDRSFPKPRMADLAVDMVIN